jgi:hypothetical protein
MAGAGQIKLFTKPCKARLQELTPVLGKWTAANVGGKSTAITVALRSSQKHQKKTVSDAVFVRNDGRKMHVV